MSNSRLHIGLLTVVFLVILRLSLGCHFFYEGVWKITHPEFSAEPFLSQAKGPAASLFYQMIPDLDGRQRFHVGNTIAANGIKAAWEGLRQQAEERSIAGLPNKTDEDKKKIKDRKEKTKKVLKQYQKKLSECIAKDRTFMVTYLVTTAKKTVTGRKHALKPGDEKTVVAPEVFDWLAEIRKVEQQYHEALKKLLQDEKVELGPVAASFQSMTLVPELKKEDARVQVIVVGEREVLDVSVAVEGYKLFGVEKVVRGDDTLGTWKVLQQRLDEKLHLDDKQKKAAEKAYGTAAKSLRSYLAENQEDIGAYLFQLDALAEDKTESISGVGFQKKRLWDKQMELRGEKGKWDSDIEKIENAYMTNLWSLLSDEQKKAGELPRTGNFPLGFTQMDLVDYAVTYGLTAIGLCLLLGFCTRLACLGGVGFMISVLLTQPPWPTIYPPAPHVVGHALLVNKDFIEMIALLMLSTTAVGRWGGLDYFIYHLFWKRIAPKKED